MPLLRRGGLSYLTVTLIDDNKWTLPMEEIMKEAQMLVEGGKCEAVREAKDLWRIIESVSYTHLTLPTNREV
eukprot:13821512-Heterocapsa_arctica.AAC.1